MQKVHNTSFVVKKKILSDATQYVIVFKTIAPATTKRQYKQQKQ